MKQRGTQNGFLSKNLGKKLTMGGLNEQTQKKCVNSLILIDYSWIKLRYYGKLGWKYFLTVKNIDLLKLILNIING